MVRPGRERLSGRVEVDEAYWGASESTVRGREIEKKALIVIAAEEDGKGIGRIRMRRIAQASATNLEGFVADVIEPGQCYSHRLLGGVRGLGRNWLHARGHCPVEEQKERLGTFATGSSRRCASEKLVERNTSRRCQP